MNNLQNKIALVTGGNSGIGYATAKILKTAGAEVIITGRRKEAVEEAAVSLGVTGIVADQSSLDATDGLVSAVKKQFGRVDILFINAGVSGLFNIESATEQQFDQIMDINFKGAYFTLSKFIPLLPEGASVIFLSSIVSRMSSPGSSIYSASKAALNSIMKTAAAELAPRKIRVNAVSPGPTKTTIMDKAGLNEVTLRQIMGRLTSKIPLARMAEAEEVGHLVAYLADDVSGFITGSEFTIDGGMTL
jgi:NAD(P)-dependent dehydrogenase (short-subunit alcohol dehydrogenase family)